MKVCTASSGRDGSRSARWRSAAAWLACTVAALLGLLSIACGAYGEPPPVSTVPAEATAPPLAVEATAEARAPRFTPQLTRERSSAQPPQATRERSSAGPPPRAEITLAAVGDLMLARDVVVLMRERGVLYPFARVLPLFDGADVLVGNLEGTLADRGEPLEKRYTFRAPPGLAEGLALAGFDAVNLANNHAYDFGAVGLADTLDALDAAGVARFGAGWDRAAALAPAFIDVKGETIALLGFDDIFGARTAGEGIAGVAAASDEVVAAVAAAAAGADYVVVSFHWGTEYASTPTARQRELAHAAIDAGADVVLGHHPHVLQPWERYGDGLIVYSLGNFVFDLDADDLDTLGSGPFETAVAIVTLAPDAPPAVEFRPAYIDVEENRPRPASAAEAEAVLAVLREVGPAARAESSPAR